MESWVLVVEVILAQSIDAPIVIMRKLLSDNLLIGQKHWLKRHKRNELLANYRYRSYLSLYWL